MKPDVLTFIDYFQSFYAKGEIYDIGSTRAEAIEATLLYVTDKSSLEFCGDSFDRENIRDILLDRRKLEEALT